MLNVVSAAFESMLEKVDTAEVGKTCKDNYYMKYPYDRSLSTYNILFLKVVNNEQNYTISTFTF